MAVLRSGAIHTDQHVRKVVSGEPLPNGWYRLIVLKCSQQDTNGEQGSGVQEVVEFDVTWPEEYANRKFWDRFNIVHPNGKTEAIGRDQLADLAEACYHRGFVMEDDDQILQKEVLAKLYIEKGTDYKDKKTGELKKGKDQNRCLKYFPTTTTIEQAEELLKNSRSSKAEAAAAPAAKPAAAAPRPAWGGQKPAAAAPVARPAPAPVPAPQPAPVPQAAAPAPAPAPQPQPQPAAQPAAAAPAPAGNVAPWKRKQ